MFAEMKKFPDKTYDFNATPTSIGDVEYSSKKGKPLQKCRLNDGVNEERVTIYQGNGIPLDPNRHIDKPLRFSLSGNLFKGTVYFQGFWRNDVELPPATEPYRAPQGAPAAPKAPKQSGTDWDAIARGKVRHGVVCAIIQHGGMAALDAVLDADIEEIATLICTGFGKTDPADGADYIPTEPEEESPF